MKSKKVLKAKTVHEGVIWAAVCITRIKPPLKPTSRDINLFGIVLGGDSSSVQLPRTEGQRERKLK